MKHSAHLPHPSQEGPTRSQVKPVTLARVSGPVYQPTTPGTYTSYAERASAPPRFAKPSEKATEIKPAIVSKDSIELQVGGQAKRCTTSFLHAK